MPPETTQSNAFHRADPTVRVPESLRRVLLLLPPLLLAALETLHPQPEPTVQAMLDAATWFAAFHAIQLVLIGFVALSVLLLADTFGRAKSWATRLGLGLFRVFFSAYDTLAGIGTGLAMRTARDLSATQQDGVLAVVQDWPGLGPPFALSILGTAGWVIAVGALALAAYRQGTPRRVWIVLALAGSSSWADTRSRPERSPSDPSSSPPYSWNGTPAGHPSSPSAWCAIRHHPSDCPLGSGKFGALRRP